MPVTCSRRSSATRCRTSVMRHSEPHTCREGGSVGGAGASVEAAALSAGRSHDGMTADSMQPGPTHLAVLVSAAAHHTQVGHRVVDLDCSTGEQRSSGGGV